MLFNMQISTLAVMALAPVLSSAAIVNLYHDTACKDLIQQVNVWDNTCCDWPEPGWGSYKLMTKGGWLQALTSYPHNVCVYPGVKGGCVEATEDMVGSCMRTNETSDGLSHSIGSTVLDFCPYT